MIVTLPQPASIERRHAGRQLEMRIVGDTGAYGTHALTVGRSVSGAARAWPPTGCHAHPLRLPTSSTPTPRRPAPSAATARRRPRSRLECQMEEIAARWASIRVEFRAEERGAGRATPVMTTAERWARATRGLSARRSCKSAGWRSAWSQGWRGSRTGIGATSPAGAWTPTRPHIRRGHRRGALHARHRHPRPGHGRGQHQDERRRLASTCWSARPTWAPAPTPC